MQQLEEEKEQPPNQVSNHDIEQPLQIEVFAQDLNLDQSNRECSIDQLNESIKVETQEKQFMDNPSIIDFTPKDDQF